jgi:hypothetical protein
VATDRVVVIVTAGCHLCDDAVTVVEQVCGEVDIGWSTRQLADLPEPEQQQWRDFVPVVQVDGAVHDVFRVDPGRLRAALAG